MLRGADVYVGLSQPGAVSAGGNHYPNQINNVLAFPGVFRGALDVRAQDITEAMKLAAGEAIAGVARRHRETAQP